MFENCKGCTVEEERKKRREEKEENEEEERGKESESKWRQRREASIPHFLIKRNHALSPLLTEND
jgi:hypothetical protein